MTCLHKLIVAQAIFRGKFLSNLMLNSLETTPTDRHRLSKRKKIITRDWKDTWPSRKLMGELIYNQNNKIVIFNSIG